MAKTTSNPKTESPPLPDGVMYLSDFEKLSDSEKQAFREANGTVTNDPT